MNKRALGLILIALGVSVWAVYAVLRMSGFAANGGVALAIHLLFVIPGAFLAPGENLYGKLMGWFRRDESSKDLSEIRKDRTE